MKQFYFPIGVILLIMAFSCDKYEKAKPDPVELTFSKPGIVEFKIQQTSKGQKPNFIIDTIQMIIINQSNFDLSNVKYAIRGFDENKKEYANFSYWQEQSYALKIEPYKESDFQQLSKSFDDIISYDNLEVDLISCIIGNREVAHKYSGSYGGNYAVYKDSAYQAFGAHYSWIDYNGMITSYFDRGDSPWISFQGQIVNDTVAYGDIQIPDETVNTSSPIIDSLGAIYFNFRFINETDENYLFNLSLIKNNTL